MTAALAPRRPASRMLVPEGRVLLHGIDWRGYVGMSELLTKSGSKAHLTYLDGSLEIMTTSTDHELFKKLIARLLEAWAVERDVDLMGYGGATFRKKAKKRGLEPDECYTLGAIEKVPAIALEVVISSPLIDKLDVYAGLGVLEVWVYQDGALTVHRLVGDKYRTRSRSAVLPELDLAELASFVAPDVSHTAQVRAYLRQLRG